MGYLLSSVQSLSPVRLFATPSQNKQNKEFPESSFLCLISLPGSPLQALLLYKVL